MQEGPSSPRAASSSPAVSSATHDSAIRAAEARASAFGSADAQHPALNSAANLLPSAARPQASDAHTEAHSLAQTDRDAAAALNATQPQARGQASDTLTARGQASDALTARVQASDALTARNKASDAVTSEDEEDEREDEEAQPPDLAKVMAEILEFPEDLDGPNDPALLGSVHNAEISRATQLQGMLAASSRLLRPPGRYHHV